MTLAGILLLSPAPAILDGPIHWRFTQKLGAYATREIRKGMKAAGAVEDECGIVTVRKCGGVTETMLLLYPTLKAAVYEVVANGKVIGADVAVNRRVRNRDVYGVTLACAKALKGEP